VKHPNEPFDEHDDASPPPLDELLSRAKWPELDAQATERLRQTWRASFDRGTLRIHRAATLTLATAAAVALAVLGGWWVLRIETKPHAALHQPEPVAQALYAAPLPRGGVREPTSFERLLATPSQTAPVARRPATRPAPVERRESEAASERERILALLRSRDPRQLDRFCQLVLDSSTRPHAIAALREMRDPPVDALMRQLANPHADRRLAAARALGEVCRGDVVDRLWRMVARDVYRREALAALTQCHEPRAGRYLTIANEDPGLESQLRVVRQQMKQMF
jgi:hypothetical protein